MDSWSSVGIRQCLAAKAFKTRTLTARPFVGSRVMQFDAGGPPVDALVIQKRS